MHVLPVAPAFLVHLTANLIIKLGHHTSCQLFLFSPRTLLKALTRKSESWLHLGGIAMLVASHIPELKAAVASQCEILTDSDDAKFREYAKRWTDIDRKIPAAIVLPTSEEGIQKTVSVFFGIFKRGVHS